MTKDIKQSPVPVKKGYFDSGRISNPIVALQHEVNKLFNSFFSDALPSLWHSSERIFNISPATDVAETDKEIRVSVELPGMEAKDVSVTISHDRVTISGKKSEEKKEEKNGYFRQERSYGEFQRVIALPDTIESDKADASINKGVLTISIPKQEGAQTKSRKLDVKQAA